MPSFAHVSDRFYKLSKSTQIPPTVELEDNLNALKQKLLQRPFVWLPNLENDFILKTDASLVAVGAVLKQAFSDTSLKHSVAFLSCALTSTRLNYTVYELKMYAVVRAVEHFRVYLLGREFLLRTDHAALINLRR